MPGSSWNSQEDPGWLRPYKNLCKPMQILSVWDTLIVKLKGLITLDITKRVEKFIEGYELNIKNAQIPKGKHKILIMIMDINYNYSERLITFTVS